MFPIPALGVTSSTGRARPVAAGLEIVGSAPEEFRKFRQADFEK
jgi:hypothetical protein